MFPTCFLCRFLYNIQSISPTSRFKEMQCKFGTSVFFFFLAYRIPSTAHGDDFACAASNQWGFAFSALAWVHPPFSFLLRYSVGFFWWGKAVQLGIYDREVKNFLTASGKGTNTSTVKFSAERCRNAPLCVETPASESGSRVTGVKNSRLLLLRYINLATGSAAGFRWTWFL